MTYKEVIQVEHRRFILTLWKEVFIEKTYDLEADRNEAEQRFREDFPEDETGLRVEHIRLRHELGGE